MKTLFVSVPQWYPMNPYLAQAILAGQLRASGYEVSFVDMNVKFFNDILTRENVLKSAGRAQDMLGSLAEFVKPYLTRLGEFGSFSSEVKTALARYKTILEFFAKEKELVNITADSIEDAVAIHKDKTRFYDPELLFRAKDTVNDALKIISLPFSPSKILIDNYIANPCMSLSYNDVKSQCYDRSNNMFIDYFEEHFDFDSLKDYAHCGISIADLSQLIPALTLGRMIKERSSAKVSFGGNYAYKIIADIKKQPEFFRLFCDYVSVGDGETAAVELAACINGELPLDKVHSLVWCDTAGNVITNETAPLLKLDTLSYPDFDDYDFSEYFTPEIVLPVQFGKGCYWGKCAFCDFYTGQQKFDIKSVMHAADEVEYLYNKYKLSRFVFVDEAVPPKFYNSFADEIKRRNIKITFYSFARFDKGFTREVIENLYEAGARFFSWGYEAASGRLLKLMNKGIDPEIRTRILNDCRDIGMWTQCTFLLGYPTETHEELQQTIDVINDRTLINSCTPSNFVLKKNAILKDEADAVGLTNLKSNGDFHISYSYESSGTGMDEVKRNRLTFEEQFLHSTADSLWSLGFTDTDHLLLYLSHYSRDWVRDYRLSYKKKV